MWAPADMSSDFQPVPLCRLSVCKPEGMSVDDESAHQRPPLPIKITSLSGAVEDSTSSVFISRN